MNKASIADPETEIRQRYKLFEKYFASADAAALVDAYYVREPLMSAPDAPLLRDRRSIEALFRELMKQVASVRFEPVEIRQSGDLAYEIGRAFLTMKDEAGTAAQARYMVAWRWTADGWRAEADLFAFGNLI